MNKSSCRPREGGDPVFAERRGSWIPAFAGMTQCSISFAPAREFAERGSSSPFVMAGLDPRLSGSIHERHQRRHPGKTRLRGLSGVHLKACARGDRDSGQRLRRFRNDAVGSGKKNGPDSSGLDPAIQGDNRQPLLQFWIAASSPAMTTQERPALTEPMEMRACR
jgi:hypothetical protein